MRWLKRSTVLALAFAAVTWVAPLALPIEPYRTSVESRASEALRRPVAIGQLAWRLLPRPEVLLHDTVIGEGDARIDGRRVAVRPSMRASLAERQLVLAVEAVGLRASERAARELVAGLAAGRREGSGAPVRVGRIDLRDARLSGSAWLDAPFDATVAVAADRGLERATLDRSDGRLTLVGTRAPDGRVAVEATARGWRLAGAIPLVAEALQATAFVDREAVEIAHLHARLYGGTLDALARLRWRDGWSIEGEVRTQGVAIAPLLRDVARPALLDGRLSASAKFATRAASPAQVGSQLRASGRFSVHAGVLRRIDLESAVGGAGPGETRFDELAGDFAIDPLRYRFTSLRIASGLLVADGDLTVGRDRSLSGRLTAGLRTGVALAAIPVAVAGTIDEPRVRPTAGAVAGAMAGTAVMPGVGTAIGARLGGAIDRWWGGTSPPR